VNQGKPIRVFVDTTEPVACRDISVESKQYSRGEGYSGRGNEGADDRSEGKCRMDGFAHGFSPRVDFFKSANIVLTVLLFGLRTRKAKRAFGCCYLYDL
jgi:hypothetical protein